MTPAERLAATLQRAADLVLEHADTVNAWADQVIPMIEAFVERVERAGNA